MIRKTLIGAVLLTTLAAPAAAHADTFCVHGPCGARAETHATLEGAVSAAAANNGGSATRDTIEIGPGELPVPGVQVASNNPVDIVGAGRDATRLIGANPGSGNAVVSLAYGNSTLKSVEITTADNQNGLYLGGTCSASDISVVTPKELNQNVGVRMFDSGALSNSTVQAPSDNASAGIVAFPYRSGDVTRISDVTSSGATALVSSGGQGATVVAERLRLKGTATGASTEFNGSPTGATLRLSSSLITVTGQGATGLRATDGTLDARHLTIVGEGASGASRGVFASPGTYPDLGAPRGPSAVTLRDSIVTGFDRPVERVGSSDPNGQQVDAAVAYSNLDTSRVVPGTGPGSYTEGDGNVSVAPAFRAPGDYRLAAGSPPIDAGDPTGPGPLESATDLLGAPRLIAGSIGATPRTDLGAFESPAPEPAANPGTPASPSPAPLPPASVKDTIAPALSGVALSRSTFSVARQSTPIAAAAGTTLRYRLSEAAKVRIAIERRTTGARIKRGKKRVCAARTRARRKAARCTRFVAVRTLTRNGRAGANTLAFTGRIAGEALKPGRYRLTLTATDSAGNRSKPRMVAFRVKR